MFLPFLIYVRNAFFSCIMRLVLIFRLHALGYGIKPVLVLFFVLLFLFFIVHAISFPAAPVHIPCIWNMASLTFFYWYSMSLKSNIIKFQHEILWFFLKLTADNHVCYCLSFCNNTFTIWITYSWMTNLKSLLLHLT